MVLPTERFFLERGWDPFFCDFYCYDKLIFPEDFIEVCLVVQKIWKSSPSILTIFIDCYFLVAKKLMTSTYNRWCHIQNTKSGTVNPGTLNLEKQIQNDKTQNTNPNTPTYGTVLLDGIEKLRIVKHGTPNLEKYLRTMWTAPLSKNITMHHVEMTRDNIKHMVMASLCEMQKTNNYVI